MYRKNPRYRSNVRMPLGAFALGAAALLLAGCSLSGGSEAGSGASPSPGASGGAVVLLTHDSFAVSQEVLDAFTARTGYEVQVETVGDAGTLANQIVLQGGASGDVVFGIDNTFASRVLDAKVLTAYTSPAASAGAADHALAGGTDALTAIDFSDVCVNIDHDWFTERNIAEPVTLADLTQPAYKDLLVVENPATSSPGLAFLLATVGAHGDDWPAYWTALRDNGVKVASSWTDAYTVDFSGSSGKGDRPLVVSYASSPPSEVPEGASVAPTGALLDTCFRQTEYAGILKGAANPSGARALIDFLLSSTFQADLPSQMWMYPVDSSVALPQDWTDFAPLASTTWTVDPSDIEAHRAEWIQRWTETVVDEWRPRRVSIARWPAWPRAIGARSNVSVGGSPDDGSWSLPRS